MMPSGGLKEEKDFEECQYWFEGRYILRGDKFKAHNTMVDK